MPAKKLSAEAQITAQRKKLTDQLYRQLPHTQKPPLSELLSPLIDFYNQQVKNKDINLAEGYNLLAEDLMSMCNQASQDSQPGFGVVAIRGEPQGFDQSMAGRAF